MRNIVLFLSLSLGLTFISQAQVTQLVSNKNLQFRFSLGKNKAVLTDASYNKIWVTDATNGGTFQLADTIAYDGAGSVLNEKLIFAAVSPATGSELWITDGTTAGTKLLKDIYPGKEGSFPFDDFALLNDKLYFTAVYPGIGRELWRTDGTTEGTTLVKDIIPGPAGSAMKGSYDIFSTGSYLLLNIPTSVEGRELWRSDGTANGTYLLKDINPGFKGSGASAFQLYHNTVLFSATDEAHGTELWKTDGTTAGTQLVKDIKPGTGSSLNYLLLYPFNDKLLFIADDGATGEEIWTTDGTPAGTYLLKDINPGNERSYVSLSNLVPIGNKLFFSAYANGTGSELWESDGTPAGTKMYKEVLPGLDGGIPYFLPNQPAGQSLFQGKYFFFLFGLPLAGVELWKSDGTAAGTVKLKTIKTTDNIISDVSYIYTTSGIYFCADDGMNGNELWKSDGTANGTQMIADINAGSEGSDILFSSVPVNNKFLFQANNGDNWQTDLYRLDVDLISLPVTLEGFSASLQPAGAQLKWSTAQEEASREFVVERSMDGVHFTDIGSVPAAGFSTNKKSYAFIDVTVRNTGKEVVYYRLQLIDADGKSTQSEVTVLKVKAQPALAVQLLGNPVQNEIKFTVKGTTQPVLLSVKDASGRTLKTIRQKADEGTIAIPAGSLLPGAYFLVAETEGQSRVVKFLKL